MKTNTIKAIALAVIVAVTISSNSFAGTGAQTPSLKTSSASTVKTIQVGRKGMITIVYKKKTPNAASSAMPKKMLSIANGYESVEI